MKWVLAAALSLLLIYSGMPGAAPQGIPSPRDKELDPETNSEKVLMLVAAGFIGGFASLLVNIFTNVALPRMRRRGLTKKLSIGSDAPHMGNARHRIVNGGLWTIEDAILYLRLDFVEADTLEPPPGIRVWIGPGHFAPLSQEQLCWSVAPNPMKVAIFAKEEQPFSLCKIYPNGILIPAEGGWPPQAIARVFLQRQAYTGRLKFVSADTDVRWFQVQINPDDASNPCTITPE